MNRIAGRILRFPLTRIVLGLACVLLPVTAAQRALRALLRAVFGPPTGSLLEAMPGVALGVAVVVAMVALLAYLGFVRWAERRAATELAARGALREVAAGAALGTALIAVTIGVLWALGCYQVTGVNGPRALLAPLAVAVGAGVVEELLLRGVVYRILEGWIGTWGALAASSALFGAAHLGNPNATVLGAAGIALEAGLLLGAAYLATRRLWLPIGLHAGWNFAQAGLFGSPVSGADLGGLLRARLEGPAWLAGGEFGAEGSVVAVLVCLVATAALLRRARREALIMAPSWRRADAGAPAAAIEPSTSTATSGEAPSPSAGP